MTRKAFISDVAAAASASIRGVSRVLRGSEDGEFDFNYTPPLGKPISIHAIAQDVSAYPFETAFMFFTGSEPAPKLVNEKLTELANFSAGSTVKELITLIASKLDDALADGSRNNSFNSAADDMAVDEESDDNNMDDDFPDDPNDWPQYHIPGQNQFKKLSPEATEQLNSRIQSDLLAASNAGFKIGVLSGMKAESRSNLLSISVKVARLGLSDEAIQAWDLDRKQYAVLLIRYCAGYKPFDALITEAARSHEIEFRVGVSNRYKPTTSEAIAAFTGISKDDSGNTGDASSHENLQSRKPDSHTDFSSLFISSSLNDFMNEQLTSLIKIRNRFGIDWDGAKRFFSEQQGRAGDVSTVFGQVLPEDYYNSKPSSTLSALPDFVQADHIQDARDGILSFPLVAMQFFMRYLTRCTEFCLVCHDKTNDGFEALKPYVCSKPLCLYQYMALGGFGPSIEYAILTQPYVVDLLISFCYVAAITQNIREYPTGMSLSVPSTLDVTPILTTLPFAYSAQPIAPSKTVDRLTECYNVKFDQILMEVVFDEEKSCPLRRGDWIVLTTIIDRVSTHHRVIDVLGPTAKLSSIVVNRSSAITVRDNAVANYTASYTANPTAGPINSPIPATTPPLNIPSPMILQVYDKNFDDLTAPQKCGSIKMLLETIPSIKEMKNYLIEQQRFAEPSLRTWTDRISPAALGLLRWIVASNRSCIVQVDMCPGQEENDALKAIIRQDEKVSNMSGWVQFRFAQGAPDKEARFNKALADMQEARSRDYPTLFAWHGSPLQNWHSIIRSGLDFTETRHGRAFGHGCYHSLDQGISLSYSSYQGGATTWSGSELNITRAMCLNEILNAPQEFCSSSPHLVVQHTDWIQSRYLFVKVGFSHYDNYVTPVAQPASEERLKQIAEIEQDPKYTPKSVAGKPIGIPRSALPASRAFRLKGGDKSHYFPFGRKSRLSKEVEPDSDPEDPEDRLFLFPDGESRAKTEQKLNGKGKGKRNEDIIVLESERRKRTKSAGDFVPGSLDQSSLPILAPPVYATTSATQALNRELKATLKTQDSTALHELGWYINREMIQNVYQWIVELHSFDPELPLSKDMKTAGIQSVILEIRFGKEYPMSPPFVRVIRPRFLPFMHGGGGHVTGGGAMCMELLTNSGWSSASSIESVLLQVRMAISNLEPNPARLEMPGRRQQSDYGVVEAMDAYIRACRIHGWAVPKDFKDFASTGGSAFGS